MTGWLRDAVKQFLQNIYHPGGFFWRVPGPSDFAALTFDDGPDPTYTPQLLDLLSRLQIKATFFVIGRQAERHPDILRRAVQEGHTIGGHTYDHRVIVTLGPGELADELERCRVAIRTATGIDSNLFRPPKGKVSFASIRAVIKRGYRLVHWTNTYSDYRCDGTEALLRRMQQRPMRVRDIVLLHDQNPHTIAALSEMIPRWQSQGIKFGALAQYS